MVYTIFVHTHIAQTLMLSHSASSESILFA
nr:MAG TPA: hypothetical protein [Caudoviricetes sp.]